MLHCSMTQFSEIPPTTSQLILGLSIDSIALSLSTMVQILMNPIYLALINC